MNNIPLTAHVGLMIQSATFHDGDVTIPAYLLEQLADLTGLELTERHYTETAGNMAIKYYEITFVYADNGQQFGTGALMNEKERARLGQFLEEQEKAGCLTDAQIFEPVRVNQGYNKALAEIKTALRS